jgi:excisionase family DNA binding protein
VVTTATEEFLSPEEVGERIGVSVYTVRRWVKTGQLRAFKPGKEYRIQKSDLEEFLRAREVRPKAPRRSPSEPSFNDVLVEERQLKYLRGWRAFVRLLAHEWEVEPPKTSADIAPLFHAMTALVEQGVFETSDAASLPEFKELALVMAGFQRLNAIADKIEKDEEAQHRRATFALIQEQHSA